MANEALKKMLEIGKRVDELTTNNGQYPNKAPRRSIEEQIQSLDNQVYGQYVPSAEEKSTYDPQAEMKRIAEREAQGGGYNKNTKVPSRILESILQNPCNLDPEIYEDQNMAALTRRLSGRMPGIKNVHEIQKKLDEADRQKQSVSESLKPKTTTFESSQQTTVDYSLIKTIVESALDEKITKLKTDIINENVSHQNSNSLNVMKMGDKFLFLDDQDNVYECKMHYIGKNKKKKQ